MLVERCYQFSTVHQMDQFQSMNSVLTPIVALMVAEKAWLDEEMMHRWIVLILISWRNTKAPGIILILILILDAY